MAMNVQDFEAALDAIEAQKGISREVVIAYLKEAMAKAYKKELGGDDANVEVDFDLVRGVVAMYNVKKVVADVQDDFLEVSLEEAQEVNKDYQVGDDFKILATPDDLRKATAMSIKSIMKQKFAEAERANLYEQFKDKVNTMITARVDTCDEKGCNITIGRSSIFLPRKAMIGEEMYRTGDPLKVYIDNVETGNKGPHISVSRSSAGFLKCLMSETISEIYNGIITIESVAREAGERSKVAVSCSDVNIDPAGACIGPNGSKIQSIVSQLGNGSSKEKIDIIAHSSIDALFILEALKPAKTVGIEIDEEDKTCTVIVKDDSLSLAIGRKGVNARLAVKLTGYKIDVITESQATEDEIEYISLETLQAQDQENRNKEAYEKARASFEKRTGIEDVLPGVSSDYVAPQLRTYEEEKNDFDEALEREVEEEEIETVVSENKEETVSAPAQETTVAPEVAPAQEEAPIKEVKPVEEEKAEVKTTTTLEDLEKKLEGDANKNNHQNRNFKRKKKVEEEEEKAEIKTADPSTYMSIYSEEELQEMENEEEDVYENDDEDIDYDQYDEYYDSDK